MKTHTLSKYGIIVKVSARGVATITSNLSEHLCDPSIQDVETSSTMKAICDCLEALILAHAAAGIDVGSAAYIEGIDTTVDALFNNM